MARRHGLPLQGRPSRAEREHRPAGAPCLRDGCPRPAAPHQRYPHLARGWCSTRCREAYYRHRDRERQAALAESIRSLLGLPTGRGPWFSLPELRAIEQACVRRFDELARARADVLELARAVGA